MSNENRWQPSERTPIDVRSERDFDDIDVRQAEDEAGAEIPGRYEVGIFAEGEWADSVMIDERRARELHTELGELLGIQPPVNRLAHERVVAALRLMFETFMDCDDQSVISAAESALAEAEGTVVCDANALRAQRDELLAVMRDVAALLPVAGRLHPKDLDSLQTRVCAAIAKAEGR